MFTHMHIPHGIQTIWSTTDNDRSMMQLVRNQRKIREKLEKHEEILKELLFYLTHESGSCTPPKIGIKSIQG